MGNGGALAQRLDVRGHHRGQQTGANCAVGRSVHAANGRREAVNRPEACIRQRQSSAEARHGHVLAGRRIVAVVKGTVQAARRPRQPLATEAIGQRRPRRADERLKALGQSVHTRARRQRRRQIIGQLGVNQGDTRQHQGATQTHLDGLLGHAKHRIARHLRTSASGGGDGDHGQRGRAQGQTAPHHLKVSKRIAGVGRQRRHRFARIEGRTAAHRHHKVAAALAGQRRAVGGDGDSRLTSDSQQLNGDSRLAQQGHQRLDAGQRAPTDNQRPLTQRRRQWPNLAQRARAANDARGGGELESHEGNSQPAASGKTVVYRMAVRGSAIISATVSRQVVKCSVALWASDASGER